jgi:malate dehydrogenase (oxaloacetate-decarboxylating)(NADP+)
MSEALDYHSRGRPGKLEVRPTKPTATQDDLSLAYSPGVAEPCLEIEDRPENVFRYTNPGHLVAVVSNGTAVLGLGDIGALASKPVMEGKAVLFKRFADIDVFDIEVGSTDPEDVIRFCVLLAPTVGGINLEDIKAPECFVIEDALRERLSIPVFHDDQHGTAIIAAAGMLNALELTDRSLADVTIVISGAGAAGIATARFLLALGMRRENLIMLDSRGVLTADRKDELPSPKDEFTTERECRTLAEAMAGADVFVGVSVAGTVTPEMVRSMAADPIVFALANPDPEIPYDVAREARPDAIVATGRSDFPNQINNVLGFPFIFRGALDVRATAITEGMKIAAARALADLTKLPVPNSVLRTYGLDRLSFGPEYLIPKPFDPRVLWHVAPAVAAAAADDGVAGKPLENREAYRTDLHARLDPRFRLVRPLTAEARDNPMRVAYPRGDDVRILRAARIVADEGIAKPILLGWADNIHRISKSYGIDLEGIEVLDPHREWDCCAGYADELFRIRKRKGMTLEDARLAVSDLDYFAAMMVHQGDADAVLGGLSTYYPQTLRPALQLLPLEEGRSVVSALYVVLIEGRTFFLADCAVNISPTALQIAEIAGSTAAVAQDYFGADPRVALVSYSNFGSAGGPEASLLQEALTICRTTMPDLAIDGEMQADTAVSSEMLEARHPFHRMGGTANVLVFPNLTAANAAYKLLHELGGADVIGPILTGLSKSVHVLQRDADVDDIVNLTAIAALDAQRKAAR